MNVNNPHQNRIEPHTTHKIINRARSCGIRATPGETKQLTHLMPHPSHLLGLPHIICAVHDVTLTRNGKCPPGLRRPVQPLASVVGSMHVEAPKWLRSTVHCRMRNTVSSHNVMLHCITNYTAAQHSMVNGIMYYMWTCECAVFFLAASSQARP